MDFNKINKILKNNGVIAFVTDTVWGLGCLPESSIAVRKIYDIKHRESKKPLIIMSYDTYPLFDYVKQPINKEAQRLIKKYLPGALTLVIEKSEKTPDYVTSDLPTVGIRVPDNETFSDICKNIDGHVLATTSANISGEPPALTYEQAIEYIGEQVDLVIEDFGNTAQGRASTVVGFKNDSPIIFRQGEIEII